MASKNGLHRRGGVYHWRRRLPPPLACQLGRGWITRSLRTANWHEARRRALRLSAELECLSLAMATRHFSTLGDQELADLIQRHLERLLAEEEDRRAESWVVGDDRLEEARADLMRLQSMIRRDLRNGKLGIGEAHSKRILAPGEVERPAQGLEDARFARFLRTVMQGLDGYLTVETARDEGRYNVKLEPVVLR